MTDSNNKAQIYVAGGCFWGTEHLFKQVKGIEATRTGYANSIIESPTYREVCSGATNAAETVELTYNPQKVDLRKILDLYLLSIDPTSVNQQGNDRGTQYRTGIYYTDSIQHSIARQAVDLLQQQYAQPLAIEVAPLKNFYPAEDYHQDYLDKNPGGYCHLNPALFDVARHTDIFLDHPTK